MANPVTIAKIKTRPLNLNDHHWTTYSACNEVDPELMFPHERDRGWIAEAKAVCAKCPVIEQCIEQRAKTGDQYGVWGGMTAEEHRQAEKAAYRRNWRARQRETATSTAA